MAIDDGGPAARVARECATCRYFDRYNWSATAGECRRYPPSLVVVLDRSEYTDQIIGSHTETAHPTVSEGAGCGEWKEAPDAR